MHWYSQKLDKKYYFKHNALADDDNPEFCMGDVYDNHDWTVEPKGSWKDVLKEHAQELRDTYKYIRLWYSGGSDSQTVLNTFVENGIHLDEIGIVRMSPINNFNAYSEHELNSVAIPQARALANKIPKTKITLYHYGYEQYKNWIDNHFVLGNTNVRSFHMFLPTTVHKLMPGINDREGLININCVEPARLGSDEKGVYWYFVDTALWENITSPDQDELCKQDRFYLDPNVHAKQCYMIKHNNKYHGFTPENFDDVKWFNDNIKDVCRDDLYLDITLGKGDFKSKYFGTPKSQLCVESALNDPEARHLIDTYTDRMMNHGLNLNNFNDNDPMKGYVGRLSKKYYLS